MQVPEKLTLIGGSILLSSTLIFTLKSQASSILPKIEHPVSTIYEHAGDSAHDDKFNDDYRQAQQKGWQTGQWGTAKFYVDDQHNMYVGKGQLHDILRNVAGAPTSNHLRTFNFTGEVQAPQDSNSLLQAAYGDNNELTTINGLENMDTSQVTNMDSIFANDRALNSINVKDWDTTQVTNMHSLFWNDHSLPHLDLSGWHTPNLKYAGFMFQQDDSLETLDLSNFDTTHANMENAYGFSSINRISLGDQTYPQNDVGIPGNWKQGETVISGYDLSTPHPAPDYHSTAIHPGTWTRV